MNYKDGVSGNNSINTLIFKQIAGSISHTHHGNESTLPLFGQGDSPSNKSEKKLNEIQSAEKLQKGLNLLPVFDNKQKENSIADKILSVDDNIRKMGTENLVLKSELAKMIAFLARERKAVAGSTTKNKQINNLFQSKTELPKERFTFIRDENKRGTTGLPELEGKADIPSEARIVQLKKSYKISKPPQLETNLVINISEGQPRQRLLHPTQPLSAKSSARNPIREAFISSARSFERATSGDRSNSSHILIRKLSDQGNEYFANQTFNSLRVAATSSDNHGSKDTKEQLFKGSRNLTVKKQIRQSRGGSTSTGIESSLQAENLESTQRVTVVESKSEFVETLPTLLSTMMTRVDNVFKQYETIENTMATKNENLLKLLNQKLGAIEAKNKKNPKY